MGKGFIVSTVSEIDQSLTQRLGNTKTTQQWKKITQDKILTNINVGHVLKRL